MQRSNGARLLPLFIVLIVIALAIAAIVSIGRAVFNKPTDANTSTTSQDVGQQSLLKTNIGRSVTLTVRGPIVADESFSSYKITVSPEERSMDVYKGYLDERTTGNTLSNNTRAYEQFVYALDKANLMKGVVPSDNNDSDVRGICATGFVYEYDVLNQDKSVKQLWTSSCEGSKGSLNASKEQLNNLFLAQIPNANDLIPFRQSPILHF